MKKKIKLQCGVAVVEEVWEKLTQEMGEQVVRTVKVFPPEEDTPELHIPPDGTEEIDLVQWAQEVGWPERGVTGRLTINGDYGGQFTFSRRAAQDARYRARAYQEASLFHRGLVYAFTNPKDATRRIQDLQPALRIIREEMGPMVAGGWQGLVDMLSTGLSTLATAAADATKEAVKEASKEAAREAREEAAKEPV